MFDERGTDVPLDEVAKTAKLANVTLHRHFATRADLIVAVYANEVIDQDGLSNRLLDPTLTRRSSIRFARSCTTSPPNATSRCNPDDPRGERSTRFAGWHTTMLTVAARLLTRAQDAQAVRPELTATVVVRVAWCMGDG